MIIRMIALVFVSVPLWAAPCLAGPCTGQIRAMQVRIDGALDTRAAAGPAATEGSSATLGHQPTPASIAAAEMALGDVSADTVDAVGAAMNRARKADRAGNGRQCRQALAEALRATND